MTVARALLSTVGWRAAGLGGMMAAAACYLAGLGGSFHYDDVHSLVENPAVRSLGNLPAFFTEPSLFSADPGSAMYRPLVLVSYALNHALGEYDPHGYHLVNLLLHLANAVVLLLLVRDLTGSRSGALAAALVFGLHPVNSEVVNYVSSRSESMSALFTLVATWGFVRWRTGSPARGGWYAVAVVSLLGALASKEVGIAVPGVLLLWDLTYGRAAAGGSVSWRRLVRAHGVFWLLGAGYLVAVRGFLATAIGQPVRPLGTQLLTQAKAWVYYAKLLWLPHPLNVEHAFSPATGPADPAVVASILLLAGLPVGFWLAWRRGRPGWAFAVGAAVWSLLPASLVPLNVLVNEHRLYLASAAFAGLLGAEIGRWIERRDRARLSLACVGLVLAAALCCRRTQAWRDERTLWEDALAKAPLMPRPHLYLGDQEQKAGRYAEALQQYAQALTVRPGLLSAGDRRSIHNNQGAALLAMGRSAEATEAYRRALSIDSTYAPSRQALEALQALERQEWSPRSRSLHRQGLVALVDGRADEAARLLTQSLELQPMPETYLALGMAWERLGEPEKARQAYGSLALVAPDSAYRRTAMDRLRRLGQP